MKKQAAIIAVIEAESAERMLAVCKSQESFIPS